MSEDKKHELTEKLKLIETEIYEARVDLRGAGVKLEIAYKYEDELLERLVAARARITTLRNKYFQKTGDISEKYDRIKNIVDVFTGNFYNKL